MAKPVSSGPGITYRDIIASIKKGEFAPVYILSGKEPYYIDLIVSWLEKSVVDEGDLDFNYSVYYGADADIPSVVAAAQQFPLMADRRLVILKEAQSMGAATREIEKLSGYVANPNATTVFAIVYKGDELSNTSKLVKAAKKSGGIVFQSPALKEYNISGPIRDYCQQHKVSIDGDASDLLVSHLGVSLQKIFGEIDKLLLGAASGCRRINREMVMDNIGINKEFNTFELTRAVASRDYPKAMRIVGYFASNPKSNPTVMIIPQLFNFFSQLLICLYSPDRSEKGLLSALGEREAWKLKNHYQAMRMYNASQALAAVHILRRLACETKGIGSSQNEHDLLKSAIFEIFTAS